MSLDPRTTTAMIGAGDRHLVWRDRWGFIWSWTKWGDDTEDWAMMINFPPRGTSRRKSRVNPIHGPFTAIGTGVEMREMLAHLEVR